MTQLEQSQKKIFANYTANETDSVLYVDSSDGPINIFINTPTRNDRLIIQDLGQAATNNIIVRSKQLINGSGSITIDKNYETLELEYDVLTETYIGREIQRTEFVFVYNKFDLPVAVNGVINLAQNATYYFLTHVDLLGDRVICADNTTILGASSENCSITSTGLSASEFLIYSDYTLPIRHITIKDVTKAIGINTSDLGAQPIALDWTGVNFSGCTTNLDCGEIDNFIFSKGAILGGGTIKFTSSVGTIGIDNSLFVGSGADYNIIELTATCIVTRRFRIIYSSIVAFGSTKGIDVDVSATVPTEAYILDTINFSGGSTYLVGLNQTSNSSLFKECVGIENTAVNGQIYMIDNATSTSIALQDTFYKIAGTTTPSSDNSKYTATDNRLTNDAVVERKYLITCNLSFTSGNGKVCEFGFYDSKLGSVRTPSRTKATANASGRAENVSFNCVVNHAKDDYLEIWASNTTDTTDITVTDMNFVITQII